MKKRTLEALRGSIQKWQKIVAGRGTDQNTRNCALCNEFFSGGCGGCPVAKRTNVSHCIDTPYVEWCEHQGSRHHERINPDGELSVVGKCRSCKKHAQAELDFLKGLLPRKRSKPKAETRSGSVRSTRARSRSDAPLP